MQKESWKVTQPNFVDFQLAGTTCHGATVNVTIANPGNVSYGRFIKAFAYLSSRLLLGEIITTLGKDPMAVEVLALHKTQPGETKAHTAYRCSFKPQQPEPMLSPLPLGRGWLAV